MLRILLFVLALCVPYWSNAQVPPATDMDDPIGQRLGWDAEKIALSIKYEGLFLLERHIVNPENRNTILFFSLIGTEGMDNQGCTNFLSYEFKDGVAIRAVLLIKKPAKKEDWIQIVGDVNVQMNKDYESTHSLISVRPGNCKKYLLYSIVYTTTPYEWPK